MVKNNFYERVTTVSIFFCSQLFEASYQIILKDLVQGAYQKSFFFLEFYGRFSDEFWVFFISLLKEHNTFLLLNYGNLAQFDTIQFCVIILNYVWVRNTINSTLCGERIQYYTIY